jgi:hypothetical protein
MLGKNCKSLKTDNTDYQEAPDPVSWFISHGSGLSEYKVKDFRKEISLLVKYSGVLSLPEVLP